MGAESPHLSIVIPVFNEERRIGATLLAIERYLNEKKLTAEVLVVSDGSRDSTARIVADYQNLFKNLRLIANNENHGKGYVVRQGMREAKGALRLFTDADNATPIEELDQLLPHIKQPGASGEKGRTAADVVIGSIGLKESKVERGESGIRSLAGRLANLLIQTTVLPGIKDTQRGFKLFTAEAAEEIFSRARIDRWGFDIEALALARKLGFHIHEAPIRWIHNPESKVKASAYLNTFWDLARIRWWLWIGAYHIR
ncbi:MAG: hypothetical protein A2991_00325 [Candidatus Terrybacteria bacterium RIFCSPLOWO2_01_FULL_58_14]|uniref:dolichyl-phosphate beta-glucosyltransferase n=2 Tax=Candidatus Terryibacteriota TaxID=1817920 RepID=A0A1G2PWP3_9BACT|nr:MAG: hypothetical protein A2682_00335 [Candidatus Terrybacteria bacterium RIFCSPHIGHO2_01_FULL_58_15]OHA52754.1 MAG: hypothetical protein A2991_00325 [Candidatus Terrybacteria bacterium RIFCSPLOWO2_01_FULL_58_14]